jgi:hypothetical protein
MIDRPRASPAAAKPLLGSFLALRRAIGVFGLALPVAVSLAAYLLDSTRLQSTISAYYHTASRDLFVGLLAAIGVFLMFYRGYDRADAVASRLSGLAAIGVALFPTTAAGATTAAAVRIGKVHLACALVFFCTLAYTSLFLFTRTHADQGRPPTRRKRQRNWIYRMCGGAMVAALIGIGVHWGTAAHPDATSLVFVLESVAIFAFGFSWLVKGETLLKDEARPGPAATASRPGAA